MLIAKNHNLFSEGDRYMRQFARIVYGLKDIGREDIGDRLQEILNSEISIQGPSKTKAINLSEFKVYDYDTVHPNVLLKPEFAFLPASMKLERI